MALLPQLLATEKRLQREADSLGHVLEQLREHISPVLIDGEGWQDVIACARHLPPTMAAFPFGFELRMHSPLPNADLGVPLVGGSQSLALFKERMRDESPTLTGILKLMEEKAQEGSPLHRITGPKMGLEYDVSAGRDEHYYLRHPGGFIYPSEQPFYGKDSSRRLDDLALVLDGVAAIGWKWDSAERGHMERLYKALPPDGRILSMGAFPSRSRSIRLAVTDFRTVADVLDYLERVDWPGQTSAFCTILSRLESRKAFGTVSIHLDVQADGVGPGLGLGFFSRNIDWVKQGRYWQDDASDRTAFLDIVGKEPIAVPQKLSALAGWSSGPQILYGKTGQLVLVRGVHHIKLSFSTDRLEQIKAYVFLLIGTR